MSSTTLSSFVLSEMKTDFTIRLLWHLWKIETGWLLRTLERLGAKSQFSVRDLISAKYRKLSGQPGTPFWGEWRPPF